MKNVIQTIGAGLLVATVMFMGIDYAFSLPEVLVSYSSKECVGVNNYPGIFFNHEVFSCENMPSKFDHVWVK